MKTVIVALISILPLAFTSCATPESAQASAPSGSVTFQVFYDELSPYGSWVSYGNYGYAWVPAMGAGFEPYGTSGHWVFTDDGWTWVSDYNWGWAPFHYGRWAYDDFYGWIWVPGYEWAPAWVVWGQYDYYYGWAPVAPGITITAGYRPPQRYWMYCPSRYVTEVNVHRHIVTSGIPAEQVHIIDNTNSGRNYYYGPRKEAVEKATGTAVSRVNVVEQQSPAPSKLSGNRLEVYRPEISKGNAAPAKVMQREDVQNQNKTKAPATQPSRNDDPVYWNSSPDKKSGAMPKNKKVTPQQRQPVSPAPAAEPKSFPPNRGGIEKEKQPASPSINNPPEPKGVGPRNDHPSKVPMMHPREKKQQRQPISPAPEVAPPSSPPNPGVIEKEEQPASPNMNNPPEPKEMQQPDHHHYKVPMMHPRMEKRESMPVQPAPQKEQKGAPK